MLEEPLDTSHPLDEIPGIELGTPNRVVDPAQLREREDRREKIKRSIGLLQQHTSMFPGLDENSLVVECEHLGVILEKLRNQVEITAPLCESDEFVMIVLRDEHGERHGDSAHSRIAFREVVDPAAGKSLGVDREADLVVEYSLGGLEQFLIVTNEAPRQAESTGERIIRIRPTAGEYRPESAVGHGKDDDIDRDRPFRRIQRIEVPGGRIRHVDTLLSARMRSCEIDNARVVCNSCDWYLAYQRRRTAGPSTRSGPLIEVRTGSDLSTATVTGGSYSSVSRLSDRRPTHQSLNPSKEST